jgi:TatD DNase family protein
MLMIDVHAHLCFDTFSADRERIAEECGRVMDAVVVGSARLDEGVCALDLCERHDKLFPTIGYHPVEGGSGIDEIVALAEKNAERICGIGEVGLDYHWVKDACKRNLQEKPFRRFVDVAQSLGKPLVIHSWDAEKECFAMVKDLSVPVVFHCYSGSRELAQEILDAGFFISMSTHVLFSKAHRKLAKDVPLERMLLETDAPFLSPYGYLNSKGQLSRLREDFDPKNNYPWNIRFSAEKIADIKKTDVGEVLGRTARNAVGIFGLGRG